MRKLLLIRLVEQKLADRRKAGAIGGPVHLGVGQEAVAAGARWFLAPEANCDEVVGHVPDGLRVFSVGTLDDALTALKAIRGDGDVEALPTCGS